MALIKYTRWILVLMPIIMLSYFVNAQNINLSGKVFDEETAAPLQNAEIYLSNTTIHAVTDTNGNYRIINIPVGKYQLIVRNVGFGTKAIDLVASQKEQTLNIGLKLKVIELSEVVITDISERKRNVERFKREFIGLDADAAECKILNEDILNIKYSSAKQLLTATTDDFLEIINPALGYKLRFLIKDLYINYKDLVYHYTGSMIFEELPGKDKDKKRWAKKRNEVYEGSFRHFMTSAAAGSLQKDGFIVKKLIRSPNPDRPPQSVIDHKITTQFKYVANNKRNNDSLSKWVSINRTPKIVESLSKDEIPESAILKPASQPQTFTVDFDGILYVIYKHKYIANLGLLTNVKYKLTRFKEAKDRQIAAVNMKTPGQPIIFNNSGIQLTYGQFFFDGTWGDARLSKQLPVDFIPDKN